MKIFSIVLCSLVLFGGCDGVSSSIADCPDALAGTMPKLGPAPVSPACSDAGTVVTDATPAQTTLADALPGYTTNGVFAYLGRNPCVDFGQVAGWDPTTGKCYPPASTGGTSGVCGATPACGSHAPGTVLLWSSTDPRFHYVDDPSGGYVCLPNNVPYVVSC